MSLAFLMLAWSPCQKAAAQEVSVRNNLIYDATGTVNAGVEFQVGDHFSVGVNGGFKSWPRFLAWDNDNVNNTTHWRHFLVAPEGRYYFSEVFKGAFVGADFIYTHFNVGNIKLPLGLYPEIADSREQGSYWAGGLFAGWAWWPWQHWRIELEAGAAVGLAAYDRFDCAHCGTKTGEVRRAAVVPKLGLNIAYNPVARDKRKSRVKIVERTDTLTLLSAPVAFVVNLKEAAGPQSAGDRLAAQKPWVIPIEKYRPLDYLTRPGKDSIQYVVFPAGNARLDNAYARNGKVLDELQGAIETIRDDERTDELLVSIVGLASIEGPQPQNDTLSVRRARAVADYLNGRTFVSRKFFETIGKGEAWDWFKDQLEAIPEGGEGLTKEEVAWLLNLVYNEKNADVREQQLRSKPALYRKVVNTLLEDQRNAGYIRVYYSNKPDAATQKLNGPIYSLISAKKYHKAVKEIQEDKDVMALVQKNPEAANAYGVALYFTALDKKDAAAEREAIGLLEKAAREGSEAAVQNLKGIETYGPARKEFEAWKRLMDNK
ncbi:MAG: DUF3575 domain-containing protein [Bacteroidales bacterium]|nr:DUF3575 domain-containing protein [Bacteroidales bacterium]